MSDAGSSLPDEVETRIIPHLSPSIVPKRNYLAVDVTLSPVWPERKSRKFSCLYVPETIECE
jgi:hypothetical protein